MTPTCTSCLCPKEVAAILGLSPRTAQRLMASGKIPCARVGTKLLRTDRAQLASYLARQFDRYRRAAPAGRAA